MPSLSKSNKPIKMFLVGESGCGKTGAYSRLADAGYRVIVADFDANLDIACDVITPESAEKRFFYQTFRNDETSTVFQGDDLVCKNPQDYARFCRALDAWESLGSITSWGPDTVFVLDTFSNMCERIFNVFYNPSGGDPRRAYNETQTRAMRMLNKLSGSGVKCHVLIVSHLSHKKNDKGVPIATYPLSKGSALNESITRDFPYVIECFRSGKSVATRYMVRTRPTSLVNIKFPLNTGLPGELETTEALPKIFEALTAQRTTDPTPAEQTNNVPSEVSKPGTPNA